MLRDWPNALPATILKYVEGANSSSSHLVEKDAIIECDTSLYASFCFMRFFRPRDSGDGIAMFAFISNAAFSTWRIRRFLVRTFTSRKE